MKLNIITSGHWKEVANYLNYNFNKLSILTVRLDEVWISDGLNFKGIYPSVSDLNSRFPLPEPGDYAFVLGTSGGETIFKVYNYSDGEWVSTGGTYSPEVLPQNYIEMISLPDIADLTPDIENYLEGH